MKELKTKDEFDSVIKDNAKVAIDFTAKWCGPCKMIGPIFKAMVTEFPGIVFAKLDVDENEDAAAAAGISAMPTFQFFKDGQKVDDLVGADEGKLKAKLQALDKS